MTAVSVTADVEILAADGVTYFEVALVERTDPHGQLRPKVMPASLQALVAGLPLTQQLQPVLQSDWSGGIGVDYNAAYGLVAGRSPGIVFPAGPANFVQVTLANGSSTPIVAFERFLGALYAAQRGSGAANTARVMRSSDGTGTGGGAFANSKNLAVNRYMHDLCLFGNPVAGTMTRFLYASSCDVNGANGELHRTSDGTTWTDSGAVFGVAGRRRLWRTYFTNRAGLSWPSLVAISGDGAISYTIPNSDPFLAASWVEGNPVDTGAVLLDLGGAKRAVFMRAQDNVFSLNEHGETPALMSHDLEVSSTGSLQYLKDYLYVASGRILNRIYVGDPSLQLQESIAHCFPGFGTRAENDIRGVITAQTTDQNYLVASVYNDAATVQASMVCWGTDQGVPPNGPSPLRWFGPEILFNTNYQITRMMTSGLAGDLRMWVASQSPGSTCDLRWVPLPIAGTSIQDLVSGGAMRFNTGALGGFFQPYARLELLPSSWAGATEIVDRVTFVSRNLGTSSSSLTHKMVADPPPGAINWALGGVSSVSVTTSPSQAVTPSVPISGQRIWQRIDFLSPSGAATPPIPAILDDMRTDRWVAMPTATALPLTVQYGDGIRNRLNVESVRSPDWISDQIALLTTSGRTTLKTGDGQRWTVKFVQLLDREEQTADGGTYGKTVTATVKALILAGPL